MFDRSSTIAALATAPGPAGVAVVRVSGPEAFDVAARLTGTPVTRRGLYFRKVYAPSQLPNSQTSKPPNLQTPTPLDEAVLLAFRAPKSYTGEDVIEFQCHGGAVTPRRVLEACLSAGARLARRGEFTERAFLNGRLDYDQAESVLDLIQAKTARAADAALEGLAGRHTRANRALYDQALALSSELEHALDIDEGELPDSFFAGVRSSLAALAAALDAAIARVREGRILRDGARVVLAGPPNAGKSSLLNALLGESRAIVSDVPGTTRDAVEAWLDLDGWPIRLVDTAGLRATGDAIEAEGVTRAEKLIADADVVLMLGAASEGASQGDGGRSWAQGASKESSSSAAIIPVHAKCDLGRGDGLNVSAKTGEGLAELKLAIVAALEARAASAAAEPSSDTPDDRTLAVLCDARATLAPYAAAWPAASVLCDARTQSEPSVNARPTVPVLCDARMQGEFSVNARPAVPVLCDARARVVPSIDLVLAGNAVRRVAERLGELVGATYSADLLDNLFSRFCIGK